MANLSRPVGVTILVKGFPIEFYCVASGKRAIAGHHQMTEMGPASARGVLRVDDSPAVFVIPETDNSVGLHRVSLGALRDPLMCGLSGFLPAPTTLGLMTENHASDLYDAVNDWGPSDDFFLGFLTETPGARALDLGCGTGGITLAAAAAGCSVMGVDPDKPSLRAARSKPGADRVQWVDGTSRAIPAGTRFDAAIMSSNVVQEILDDAELARSFRDIAAHLVPGGRLAFDARDPDARGWEAWTKERSHRIVDLPEGKVEHWYQTTHVDQESGLVDFCAHEIAPDGTERVECGPLRFRSQDQLRLMLEQAGMEVENVLGGYQGESVGNGVGALLVIAVRP